jgi:hypothetical protein
MQENKCLTFKLLNTMRFTKRYKRVAQMGREPSLGFIFVNGTYWLFRGLRLPMEILHEGLQGEYQAAP